MKYDFYAQLLKYENIFIGSVHEIFFPGKFFFVIHQILVGSFCFCQLFLVIFYRTFQLMNSTPQAPLGKKIMFIKKQHPDDKQPGGNRILIEPAGRN